MAAKGVVLASNISLATGGTAVTWTGGKTALVINATAYGTTVNLQVLGPSGAWINVNATTYSADQMTPYDLPAGQYRMNSNATTTGLYAVLVSIPYT